jgi:hypothetical protein
VPHILQYTAVMVYNFGLAHKLFVQYQMLSFKVDPQLSLLLPTHHFHAEQSFSSAMSREIESIHGAS